MVHLQLAKWVNDWLYVRYVGNVINWTNNIVSNTGAVWSNQSKTGVPTFQNNVYFNCAKLNVADVEGKSNMFADEAGKVEDPEYKDAAKGDFTIGNESIKKLGVGAQDGNHLKTWIYLNKVQCPYWALHFFVSLSLSPTPTKTFFVNFLEVTKEKRIFAT